MLHKLPLKFVYPDHEEILFAFYMCQIIFKNLFITQNLKSEAQFVRAEKNVKELNLSVDLMKNESRKLLERAALAEKDMKCGHTELMNTGSQLKRLAKTVFKVEAQAAGLFIPALAVNCAFINSVNLINSFTFMVCLLLEGGPVVLLWKFYFINAVIIHFVDLMDGLRETPGREALKLRSEVASMTSLLKQQRIALDKRIMKISELGVPV
ncbi:hypothetical protein CK203_009729 [Vitis vinifera]|uniref:Uncharacterized protein n=1 Tax=Vitis vinifera TaxID=29760 RepID=A0A438JV97_VITVI|nr:hypothetical protein CK203_104325 [Vitis vinifera]RVX12873.1 hypothetical protein CK203_009729 [Vitis vinifera]